MSNTRPIAYLLKRYPRLSETFILHEILELERQGLHLQIFSLLQPEEQVVHADVARVRAPVRYLPQGRSALFPYVTAHLSLLRRTPYRYISVVAYILQRRKSKAAVKHFVRAGWLARELERTGAGHLHAHFAHGPATVAHFVALLTRRSFSMTAHAKDIYTSSPDLLALKMRAARFVVTCTGYNTTFLRNLVGRHTAERIHRLYHGVDLRMFSPNGQPAAAEIPLILAVGRLVEKKGFPHLIEACAILQARGRPFRLSIVGGGEGKEGLRQQITSAGLDKVVEILPPRPQAELIPLYRQATVFVLPCIVTENGDRDGIPNVLVEAMCLGLPVISTAISGIPELIIHGETGLLTPPRDALALAEALTQILDAPDLRARLSANGVQHVLREFDLATNAVTLKRLFWEVQQCG